MTKVRNWLVGLAGLAVAISSAGHAEPLDKATRDTLHGIITQQIEAFGKNDATTAESFAAPGIKAKFADAQAFLDMVNRAYSPLVHPRSTHFDEDDASVPVPSQKVTIVDAQGQVWTALYTFEQVDGSWKITGCVLIKEQSTTI